MITNERDDWRIDESALLRLDGLFSAVSLCLQLRAEQFQIQPVGYFSSIGRLHELRNRVGAAFGAFAGWALPLGAQHGREAVGNQGCSGRAVALGGRNRGRLAAGGDCIARPSIVDRQSPFGFSQCGRRPQSVTTASCACFAGGRSSAKDRRL